MRRRKNRFYRWIAAMLTVALLAGQCNVPVLAKEETVSQKNGVSKEKTEDGTGGGVSDDAESGGTGDDVAKKDGESDNDGAGDNEAGAGNGNADEGTESGSDNTGSDNGGINEDENDGEEGGSGNDGAGDQGTGEGDVGNNDAEDNAGNEGGDEEGDVKDGDLGNGTEQDGTDNAGGADDGENNGENDGEEDTGNAGAADDGTRDEEVDCGEEDGEGKCVCETLCSAENVNEECPVCAADYSACAKNTGEVKSSVETVSGNDDELPVETAVLAVGDIFLDDKNLRYRVIDDDQVEVLGHKEYINFSGSLTIPETVSKDGVTYRVVRIGDGAFSNYVGLTEIVLPNSIVSIGNNAFYNCLVLQCQLVKY